MNRAMRLRKAFLDHSPVTFELGVFVVYQIIDADGFYMATCITRELHEHGGLEARKLIADDLHQMRKSIRDSRGTRVRPSNPDEYLVLE